MTTGMTIQEKNTEAAFSLYAESFGEKAAKRNAGRIARLAELIGTYGAANVELKQVHTSHWTEAKAVKEGGDVVLGSTSTSSTKTTFVIAVCHENVAALPVSPVQPAPVPAAAPVSAVVAASSVVSAPVSRGQLWEECPSCGTEPVCAGCGYCDRHCSCGASSSYVKGEIYGGAE